MHSQIIHPFICQIKLRKCGNLAQSRWLVITDIPSIITDMQHSQRTQFSAQWLLKAKCTWIFTLLHNLNFATMDNISFLVTITHVIVQPGTKMFAYLFQIICLQWSMGSCRREKSVVVATPDWGRRPGSVPFSRVYATAYTAR